MDNYVVRIYLRDTKNPRLMVGVVEEVGVDGKQTFHSLDELWKILKSDNKLLERKRGIGIRKGAKQDKAGGRDPGGKKKHIIL